MTRPSAPSGSNRLSAHSQGRDNNFNLIRIAAAMAVLISHGFPLSLGKGTPEPLENLLGMKLGSIAVDVFFITSGFLVTSSLALRQNVREFLWSRFLRIYPGALLMVALTVFLLGTCMTTISLQDYFRSRMLYTYLARCATLVAGVAYPLPGVFETNPYPAAVNGSLWTMPYELRMYGLLAIAWMAAKLAGTARLRGLVAIVTILASGSFLYVIVDRFRLHGNYPLAHLFYMFFVGAACHAWRERVVLSTPVFLALALALTASAWNDDCFFVVYLVTLPYILFYLAYVPRGLVRLYNRLGDYSYGVYIYAFPVEQTIMALRPGTEVFELDLAGAAITLALAALSWHLVEKRALALKGAWHASRGPEVTQPAR